MSLIASLLLLLAAPGDLLATLPQVNTTAEAKAALTKTKANVRWLAKEENQALAEGLIKSRLLETLNRLGRTPVDSDGGLDPTAFEHIAVVNGGAESWVLAFAKSGSVTRLSFALERITVPVDPTRASSDPSHLHALKDALATLTNAGVKLEPKRRDPYGNVFGWEGRSGTRRVSALYLPEEDELRVLWQP